MVHIMVHKREIEGLVIGGLVCDLKLFPENDSACCYIRGNAEVAAATSVARYRCQRDEIRDSVYSASDLG